jgi:hypothetical protein
MKNELKKFSIEFNGLSTRTANLVWQSGLRTRKEAKRAIKLAELRPGRNGYGPKAHAELCKFLGIGQ